MEPPTLEELMKRIGISQDQLEQTCSNEQLNSISLFLDWRNVAPHLGLSKTDIRDIEYEKRTESERRLETLQKWKTKYGSKATLKSLVMVLLTIENTNDAERVCHLLQSRAKTGECSGAATLEVSKSQPLECSIDEEIEELEGHACGNLSGFASTRDYLNSTGPMEQATPPLQKASREQLALELEKKMKPQKGQSTNSLSLVGGHTTPKSSRSDIVQEDKVPVYGCGCGHCTFSVFIEKGCPDPTITKTGLPFLDTSKLGEVEREYLVGQLYDESRQMVFTFQRLVSKTFTSLHNQGITPSQLSISLLSLSTLSPVLSKSQQPLFHERFNDLQSAKSIYDVGFVIHDYLSFFHYEVLEHIIEAFGTSEDKAQLELYKSKLDKYCTHRLFECPPQYGFSCKSQHVSVAVKLDEDLEVFTVKQLKRFWSRLARHLHLSEYALRLVSVEEGCMQLLFQIPSFVISLVFPLSIEQETALKEDKVIELKCGLHIFSSKRWFPPSVTPPASLPPPSSRLESSQQDSQKFDIIDALHGAGVPHITEQILSYLDRRSLTRAEAVSTFWRAVVGESPIWKNLVKQTVKSNGLWRDLFERRGWNKYLQVSLSQQTSSHFYRHLYQSASRDICTLEANWRRGCYTFATIDTCSEILCLQCDDYKIITGHGDNTIKIWDRSTLQLSKVLKGHKDWVWCLQYNTEVIISGSNDATVKVWDIQTGQIVNELLHHKRAVLSLKFTTETLVTGSQDETVAVWDIKSPTDITLRAVLKGHGSSVWAVDLSETNIISGGGHSSSSSTIKVWDSFTGGLVRTLHGHSRAVKSLQLRGSHLISGSWDKTVRIWNIESAKCVKVLHGHEHDVYCVTMDDKRIISGGRDGTVKAWDLAIALDPYLSSDDISVATLKEHTGTVHAVSSDAFQLITGCADGCLVIHDFLQLDTSS